MLLLCPIRKSQARRLGIGATAGSRKKALAKVSCTLLSTDWAVPDRGLADTVVQVRRWADEAGLMPPVVFGHAGNGHPHCNYIGHDADEVKRIEAVVERTLREVLTLGGTVGAQHGLGKLKAKWLALQFSATQQRMLRAIKRELDPAGLLAPGNILGTAR